MTFLETPWPKLHPQSTRGTGAEERWVDDGTQDNLHVDKGGVGNGRGLAEKQGYIKQDGGRIKSGGGTVPGTGGLEVTWPVYLL